MSAQTSTDDRYLVPALARGLQLLMQFNRNERELSGAELARRMDLPRASVFRMLHTLEANGFIERARDGASYKLGLGVLRMGFELLASMELTEMGRPVIETLRDRSGESAHIMVRDGRDVVCIAKAPGPNAVFHAIQVGARLPAHATVLGRLLLSDLGVPELSELYPERPLPAYTPRTPTTVQELKRLMDESRKQGYAVSQGGFEASISTIAAPVFNESQKVVATVSLSMATPSIPAERVTTLVALVLDAAKQLSDRISHLPVGNRGRDPQTL